MGELACDGVGRTRNLLWGCFEPHLKPQVIGHLQRKAGLKGKVYWHSGLMGSARTAFRRASKDRRQFVLSEFRRFVEWGITRLFVVDHDRCARDQNGQLNLNYYQTEIENACCSLHEAFPKIEVLGYVISFREDAGDISFRMRRVCRFEAAEPEEEETDESAEA